MCQLTDKIINSKLKSISIIGMAKNTGKTVTLNHLIKKIKNRGLSISVLSYGRDGEEIDAVTNKEKPKIFIPSDSYFVTASKAYSKSRINAVLIKPTEIKTLMGKVNIYKSTKTGDYIELIGVNTVKQVKYIKKYLLDKSDLFLLDGAVDRKSSAVPEISDGYILATGAVIANSEKEVVSETITAVKKLSLGITKNQKLKNKADEEILKFGEKAADILNYKDGSFEMLRSNISFENYQVIRNKALKKDLKAIFLNGALLNSFLKICRPFKGLEGTEIVVRDGTKVFLDGYNLNLLKKYNITLSALVNMRLLGITVNPTTPYGRKLSSEIIITSLKNKLNNNPIIVDIKSEL